MSASATQGGHNKSHGFKDLLTNTRLVHYVVCLSSDFDGTHCAYLQINVQAELSWVSIWTVKMVYPPADGYPSQY